MPVIGGQKFACDSCIKGHRVSNCTHEDRDLKAIAPKGRPVKQCEHCRTARKSKSHHAKCDCGNKKTKKETKPDVKEETVCVCDKTSVCHCGNRAEGAEARLEAVLQRTTHPVKSKPRLTSSTSESKLTVFTNGHHPPVHRNNNLAHTSGAPYKIPRPHTLHGTSDFAKSSEENDFLNSIARSADDIFLLQNQNKVYSLPNSQSHSVESFKPMSSTDFADFSYDLDKHFNAQSDNSRNASDEDLASSVEQGTAANYNWYDSGMTAFTDDTLTSTSPNFAGDFDWSAANPYSMADNFGPSDLPIVSPQLSVFAQAISQSGESSYQSAPGLTSGSSGAQSEPDLAEGLWSDQIQIRDTSVGGRWSPKAAEPVYFKATSAPDRQTAGFGTSAPASSSVTSQGRHMSSSSTITAINLAAEDDAEDSSERAIMIPAASDDNTDDWSWQLDLGSVPPHTGEMAREYNWLLES